MTFTTANWNIARTVNVTGVDDADTDGNLSYKIIAVPSSTDPDYDSATLNIKDVQMQNVDDESAGYILDPDPSKKTRLFTDESSGQDTFTIVLTKAPSSDVTLTLSSNKPAEGFPTPATLVFTPANWNAPQTVTVTGVDDGTADGDQNYSINFDPAVSSDGDYNGFKPGKVECKNLDNE